MTTCVNQFLGADTDIDDDDNGTGEHCYMWLCVGIIRILP